MLLQYWIKMEEKTENADTKLSFQYLKGISVGYEQPCGYTTGKTVKRSQRT